MALDQAWAVGGGAENPIEGARLATYVATNGGRGVILPGDMSVRALATPGPFVRVVSGACVSPNDYLGVNGGGQSYSGREASSTDVPVAPTGSSGGQVKYLIWAIHDEQYEPGLTPSDPVNDPRNNYEWVSSVNGLTYPHVLLVRLDQPENTATITNSMLTDLREIATPKEKSFIYPDPTVVATEEVLTDTTDNGELFPDMGSIKAPIPWWATRVQIEAEWLQVAQDTGDFNGRIWVEWGPYVEQSKRERKTQEFAINGNNSDNLDRAYWKVADEMFVPPALRGTNQIFFMKGRILSHSGGSSRPKLDSASGIVLNLRFLQAPDNFTVNE